MMNSIIKENKNGKKSYKLWSVLFWIGVWQIVSMVISQEMLIASPVSVVKRLFELAVTGDLWYSVLYTFTKIMGGYFIAMALSVLFAALSSRWNIVHDLLAPLMSLMKSTPVASITILILIWVSSKNLSLILGIIMVLPIMYSNILSGIKNTDKKLLEMAEVFRIPLARRIRYIYIPQVMPFFRTACKLSLGICWKAGVAAEVIGRPKGSIGDMLYQAKVYLETPDLFAWTLIVVIISILLEKLLMWLLDLIIHQMEVS